LFPYLDLLDLVLLELFLLLNVSPSMGLSLPTVNILLFFFPELITLISEKLDWDLPSML
jgi:hypothetical protein